MFIGTLFNSKELACIKDCIIAHERVHLVDAAYDSPCYQKDAGIQVYNPSASITDNSEIRAYRKSLGCLRSKLIAEKSKQCPECEAILKTQIGRQEDLLQRYQYDYDGLKHTP